MNWKPNKWGAGALSLIAPPLGILYVNRGKLAVLYFALAVAFALVQWWVYVRRGEVVPFTWGLSAFAAFHAYRIASRNGIANNRRWYSRWFGLFVIALGALSTVVLIRAALYEPFRLPAQSMFPTLQQGAILIVQKHGYGNYEAYGFRFAHLPLSEQITRGDLLAFESPKDRNLKYVKRVIGLPGDHIEYRNKRLFVNDKPATVRLLLEQGDTEIVLESLGEGGSYTVANKKNVPAKDFNVAVKDGEVFFLGDNRDNSFDSRYWGSAPYDHIVGKVIYVFPPKDA